LLFRLPYVSLVQSKLPLKKNRDDSVVRQKKPPLPEHTGFCVAGELDFFVHFSNLYHAYAFGSDYDVRAHAGMS